MDTTGIFSVYVKFLEEEAVNMVYFTMADT